MKLKIWAGDSLVEEYLLPLPQAFFWTFEKTELPKKLSHKKTEAFWKKKLSVPEEFQGHQAEKKLSLHFFKEEKCENITYLG